MSMNWLFQRRHGIFNPSMFSSAPDQVHQGRMDFKGETALDHVVFWFDLADRQVQTRRSPFSLWDLAGLDKDALPLPHTG